MGASAGGGVWVGTSGANSPAITYCDVWGNTGGDFAGTATPGTGCTSGDPLFAASASGDFHLQSKGGRWTPGDVWVEDTSHSPCIDAGDPAADYSQEPGANGGRVNMGVHGNTAQASQSATVQVWVDDDWTGPDNCGGHAWGVDAFAVIQDAIDAAREGALITVYEGTHAENLDFKAKALTVTSTAPTDPNVVENTIIDGHGAGACASFFRGEGPDTVLTGFTLTNGIGRAVGYDRFGGGVYCDDSSPTLTHNVVEGNSADLGGGVSCRNASPTITRNVIQSNLADDAGGGIYCDDASPTISHNTITRNTTDSFADGAGIHCRNGSSPTISHNAITLNAVGGWADGGGVFCLACSPTITANSIADNQGDGICGSSDEGVQCRDSSPSISDNEISGNGDGILLSDSSPVIAGNTISRNEGEGIRCLQGHDAGLMACLHHSIAPEIAVRGLPERDGHVFDVHAD